MEDATDLQSFARNIEDDWSFELHGRRMRVVREADELLQAEEDPRRAVASLAAPVTLTLEAIGPADDGEDEILAVNLARRLDPAEEQAYRAGFDAAVRVAVDLEGGEAFLPSVEHFRGGPCDEERVCCCIVAGVAVEPAVLVTGGLLAGVREAQAKASASSVDPPEMRRRLESSEDQPSEEGPKQNFIRLLVFWGSARWRRRDLLAELARGSWGICRAGPRDLSATAEPSGAWDRAYERLRFAPRSSLSADYARRASERGEDEGMRRLLWAAMRRLATREGAQRGEG